jgi:hypothetical protein
MTYPQTLTVKKLVKMGFFTIKIPYVSSSNDPNSTHTKNHNFFSLEKMVSGFLVAAYYDLSFFHCSHSVTFIHVKRTAQCSLEKIIGQSYSMYSFLLVMAIWAVFV